MATDDKEKSVLFSDDGFPDRLVKTSVLLSLIIIAGSLSYMSFVLTTNIAIGCLSSIALLKTTWWTIQYALWHKREKIKGFPLDKFPEVLYHRDNVTFSLLIPGD